MSANLTRRTLLPLTAFALTGALALHQTVQAQTPAPVPPPAAQQPAPIERQPPSDGQRGGPMRPGMRPGTMHGGPNSSQRGGRANFRGSAMMHGGPGFKGGPGGFHSGAGFHGGPGGPERGAMGAGMGDGHFGPGGMWWKNPMLVQRLTLTPDQVKRMDAIFQQSRIELIDLKANLEKQEVLLEPMLSANPPDTPKATLQIDKVADARASLEKSNAKMLLGIRAILTPDQWTKLHTRGGPGPASNGTNMDDTRP